MDGTVNERLVFLVNKLSLGNAKEFARQIGMPYGTFQHYVNPNKLTTPKAEALSAVVKCFPQINANWLLTGEGKPFIQEGEQDGREDYKVLYDKSEAEVGFLRQQLAKLTDSVHHLSKSARTA